MEKRIGCVTIILERQKADVGTVNELISQFGDAVVGRLGLPYPERGVNIITLIVDATTDQVGDMTGRLGKLAGVSVKSALSKGK